MPPQERAVDAGEPAGTAGIPILQALRGREISDVVAVVVRWFGGVKLGKGGLARAYAEAVRIALEELPLCDRAPRMLLLLTLPYDRVGGVKRLIHPPEIELTEQDYGEQVRITLSALVSRLSELEENLAELGVEVVRKSG
jgi:putative IMPACT (imprinted ancient) family translation regulator